jgi:ketosteroid isomerase-like protein
MKNSTSLLLIVIIFSTACTDKKSNNITTDEGVNQDSILVRSLADKLSQAARDNDADAIANLHADSFTALFPKRPASTMNRDSLAKDLQSFFMDTTVTISQLEREIVDLKISNDLAVVQSKFKDQYITEKDTIIVEGKDITVWEFFPNDGWKITLMMNDEYKVN